MSPHPPKLIRWLVASLALLAASARAAESTLALVIRPAFNGEPLLLDSLRYQNAAGETLSVTRLSYLLSSFALERESGGWVEFPGLYAWMDAAKHRGEFHLPAVPAEKYRAVRFDVGLDPDANGADSAKWPPDHPLNANLNDLNWSWQGGYIFLALEGSYRNATGVLQGYALHFARDPNRTRINLTASIDLTHDAAVLLDFDLGALLNAPRAISFARDGGATHSRDGDPLSAALGANLPGAFRVRQVLSATPEISRPTAIQPLYLPKQFTPYRFTISKMLPIPDLPRDNPLIEERVALGQRLFSEKRLSHDGSLACASCHQSASGFSDPRQFSLGVRDQMGTRHAMPLLNLAWKSRFFWDGRAPSLRAQALIPIQDHTEMDASLNDVTSRLAADPAYPDLFAAAFDSAEITSEKIGLALEQYLLTLTADHSRFDRAMRGQATLSADEQRGFELFMTEYDPRTKRFGADCFHCHGGALFTDHQFHNNGLAPNETDPGLFRVTQSEADRNKFATPSLRNVAQTGPYMHDGRFATLEQVVAHYSSGVQRSATLDPNLAKHPEGGLQLSAEDQRALVAFLQTLSEDLSSPSEN